MFLSIYFDSRFKSKKINIKLNNYEFLNNQTIQTIKLFKNSKEKNLTNHG